MTSSATAHGIHACAAPLPLSGATRSARVPEDGGAGSTRRSETCGSEPEGDESALVPLNDLTVSRTFADALRRHGMDSLSALFRAGEGESLRKPGLDEWRERVRVSLCVDGEDVTFYLKRYANPPREASRRARRVDPGIRSVAAIEWHWLRRLAEDGLPAPRAVALGEEFDHGREVRSVVMMTATPGDSLERVLGSPGKLDPRRIRGLVRPLAALIGRFHQLGYVHRDLYLSHVFLETNSVGAESFAFIDLQRVLRSASRTSRRIVKDLAALNYSAPLHRVTRTERLRWLRWYLRANALPFSGVDRVERDSSAVDPTGGKLRGPSRRLVYRILGKTLQIQRHQARREGRAGRGGSTR